MLMNYFYIMFICHMKATSYLRLGYRMEDANHLSNLLLRDVTDYSPLNISGCRKIFCMIFPFGIRICKHSRIIMLIIKIIICIK